MERRKKRSERGLVYIPPELWSNVLSRVPVKSVMRFRCVCRTWCWLIYEPNFGPLHLNNFTLSHQMNDKYDDANDSSFLFTIEREQGGFRNMHTFERTDPFPVPNGFRWWGVSDVVNGVVLICINRQLILWNPSLHKYIVMFARFPYYYNEVFGLGYDSITDDYKVIIVMDASMQSVRSHLPHLMVYSAQAGGLVRWSMGDVPIHSGFNSRVFLHGAIHRLKNLREPPVKGSRHSEEVVAFDAMRETFHYIELPECTVDHHGYAPFHTHLTDFTGCLALFEIHKSEDRCVLWVMETYGKSETWAKRYTIYLDIDLFRYLTEDGDIVYILSSKVKTFSIRSGKMKNMDESFPHLPGYINCYKESLALYNL